MKLFSAIFAGILLTVGLVFAGLRWLPSKPSSATGITSPQTEEHAGLDMRFETEVRAILEENCLQCHDSERQKGGLRLDTLAAALEGGDSGPALERGDALKSHLYQLVSLDPDDPDRMPAKGDALSAEQLAILKRWIDGGAEWTGTLVARAPANSRPSGSVPKTASRTELLGDASLRLKHSQQVDAFIDAILEADGGRIDEPASDEIFIRRAYLDIAGRIPTLDEYEAFMKSSSPTKRTDLVDQLLDSPAFVSHTLNLWQNALRVKSSHRKLQSKSYVVWLRKAIQDNMPYDQFVWEQLSAIGHIDNPETAASGYFIRDRLMPQDRVATTMQLFLGTSMVCAQCHDHPTDKWTQMDFYKLLAFFNGTITANGGALGMTAALEMNGAQHKGNVIMTVDGRELNRIRTEHHYKVLGDGVQVGGYGKVRLPDTYAYNDAKPNELINADTPFGDPVEIDYSKVAADADLASSNKVRKMLKKRGQEESPLADVNSRTYFADWATSPENPMFTKTIVNRLWNRVFGVPLIGDLINISESDMGPSPELTAYLIDLMKSGEYDQKLFLEILYKTDAYQRVAYDPPALGQMPIGAPIVKRLSSEQIWDSIVALRSPEPDADVTKGTINTTNLMYVEMNKREGEEQFSFVSDTRPLTQKADPALAKELSPSGKFDLNKRASLIDSPASAASFLGVFGQAEREIIDDSVQEATITQALYLMNGEEMRELAMPKGRRGGKGSELVERLRSYKELNKDTITWAYNAILSRDPSPTEAELVTTYLGNAGPTALQDLVWSLVNTNEFKLKR